MLQAEPEVKSFVGASASSSSDSSPTRSRPSTCRSCWQHKWMVVGLSLSALVDTAATAALSAGGRPLSAALWLLRAVLLLVGFVLSVKLGLGTCKLCNRCCVQGDEEAQVHHGLSLGDSAVSLRTMASHSLLEGGATASVPAISPSLSRTEEALQRQREQADTAERNTGRRNAILMACFLGITVQSTFTGLQVLYMDGNFDAQSLFLTVTVACMNLEFLLMKRLVERLTEEDGVSLPALHEHPLFFSKVKEWAQCKICRERIGPRTGSHEGFKCRECDNDGVVLPGGDRGGNWGKAFWICLPCYRKQISKDNASEGILRGDKGPKYIPELTTMQYFLRALKLTKPFRFSLTVAVLCVFLTQASRVFMPNYQGDIINELIRQDEEAFRQKLTAFVILSVLALVTGSIQSLAVEIVQRRITCDMRSVMFESLIKQDIAFFDGTMTGQLTSRMTNDVAAVVQPVRQIMNTLLTNILRLAGGLFMCLFTSWKLTILASTLIGPIVYLTGVYASWSKKVNLAIRVNMADANAIATEALRNIRTVRSFGADDIEVKEFNKHMGQALQGGMRDAYASAGVSAATQYLDFAATILILWYGGLAVLGRGDGSHLQIGNLITFNLYWNMMNNAISSLNGILNTLVRAASAAQRVFEIIDLEPDIALDGGELKLGPGEACAIEFNEVRFRYQMRPDKEVLTGLSFCVPAGQTVAVVGRSGAGKSTLVSLLLRFYDPPSGQVLLNGAPLHAYHLRQLQKRIGVVSQETQVFCRPIYDNLAYGMELSEVNEEQVIEAAKMANAHEFIGELDEGYKSMVGEGGVRLSGGQKQRLAIARALLRRPSLLLLDEATSALDAENEGKVQAALDGLVNSVHGRCTVFLIAHRLSTVMGADKIVVMDSGQVVEQGSHDQLLENDHIYASLVKRQIARQANIIPEDGPAAGAESASQAEGERESKDRGKGSGKGFKGKSPKSKSTDGEGKQGDSAPDSIDSLFSQLSSKGDKGS